MRNVKIWWFYITATMYLTNVTTGDELSSQPKIIIVGAGPSGIAAASKLFEHGFRNVTILEAENRIGGRIHTTWFDGRWIDLGAQWVHGETDNIVFELASPFGLLEVPQGDGPLLFTVYTSEGNQVPSSISDAFLEVYLDAVASTGEELQGNNGSVGDYYTRKITTEAARIPEANETLTRQFLKLSESLSNADDASGNWFDTSARGYIEYWECPGNKAVVWIEKGYQTVLDILMKRYPSPENELPVASNTVFNTEVANVNYDTTGGKVLVESSDGTKYEADHVIVTPSLGVLKEQYEALFTPQLPESKVKTIKGLAMGSTAKIFLSFESAWWPQNSSGFAFIWNDSDELEYKNDPDKKWLLDVVGCFVVKHRPRILICWVLGSGAHYMETLPQDQVFNQTYELFKKFVGKSYNIPRPTGMIRTQWYINKHFRGSYSFRSMESEQADVWAEDLAAPLMVNGRPIVMFAGEATSPHRWQSVNGAIETGFREADRLIELYKNTPE